jgi:hypothetical protein
MVAGTCGGMIADDRTILLGFLGVGGICFGLSAYGTGVRYTIPQLEAKPQSALIDLLARTLIFTFRK